MAVCDAREWDEKYTKAIQSVAEMDNSSATALAAELRGLRDMFEAKSQYRDVRRRVAETSGPIRSQLRVESGSLGATLYRVIWVLESKDNILLLSNLKGQISVRQLGRALFDQLYQRIVGTSAWEAPSAADFAMADGTAYFVSICTPQGTGQFVVYAPVLDEMGDNQERSEFGKRTNRQASVLRQIQQIALRAP